MAAAQITKGGARHGACSPPKGCCAWVATDPRVNGRRPNSHPAHPPASPSASTIDQTHHRQPFTCQPATECGRVRDSPATEDPDPSRPPQTGDPAHHPPSSTHPLARSTLLPEAPCQPCRTDAAQKAQQQRHAGHA
ncbi:hypothetical protein CALCODRAFT_3857 [Calocera cornea HHB12733]|uniref:Uncharacterized protein n=1 Tax=Calocera cornea HHB12733 TaxID=1353952 RepID=A0A165KAB0_9BASI|nr:hypothetical protein CALCODRAFT_3857 [Calocera cornea HHB12733]